MTKGYWRDRIITNILKSSSTKNFELAIAEWGFKGRILDRKTPVFICELCGHPHVRYHHVITNKITNKRLMVGSSCILKYNTITIYDKNNNKITNDRLRKNALDDALTIAKFEMTLVSLRELWKLTTEKLKPVVENQVKQYVMNKYITPKVCLMWFELMNNLDVSYEPHLFKINLRKAKYLDQAVDFKQNQVNTIAPALTSAQNKRLLEVRCQN